MNCVRPRVAGHGGREIGVDVVRLGDGTRRCEARLVALHVELDERGVFDVVLAAQDAQALVARFGIAGADSNMKICSAARFNNDKKMRANGACFVSKKL